ATELGLDIAGAQVLSPTDPALVERFAAEYARLRAHKGITLAQAADTVTASSGRRRRCSPARWRS
ncbi:hypothetical protein CTI14_56345, partial [Methylobacterium radiotolerans]